MSPPEERIAIAGVGVTELGALPDKSGTMLATEAMRAAIADSGIRRSDVDGVLCQPGHGYGPAGEAVLRLGLPVNFYADLQTGGTSAIISLVLASGALFSGEAKYVISVYATKARTAKVLVGGSQEETGIESVNQRCHANLRPDAMMHEKSLTVEDYCDSPWVVEPFRRFDYCMMNDGAAAFVITTESRARDLPKQPVVVMGSGLAHAASRSTRGGTDYESDLDVFIRQAREKAFAEAGVGCESIDVAEFYDPFSNYPIMQAEAYGWCGPGEGSDFYREGRGTLGGELPVNTHGGHLSWGYLQGYGPLLEGVRQLRGQGGATQVPGARIALVSGSGEGSAGSPAFGNLILGVDL